MCTKVPRQVAESKKKRTVISVYKSKKTSLTAYVNQRHLTKHATITMWYSLGRGFWPYGSIGVVLLQSHDFGGGSRVTIDPICH